MFRRLEVTVLVVLFTVFVSACGGQGGAGEAGREEEALRVVATFSVIEDFVENVAGDDVEVTTLVGPAEDTHTFEASPADSRALAEADLVFENGLEFESWMDDLYASSGSDARRVTVTRDVSPLEAGESHDEHGEEHAAEESGEEGAHEHGELDPHVWLDPNNAVLMVEAIRDALVEADPENAETYERNVGDYAASLEELDAAIVEQTGTIPEGNRKLVTGHQVFAYFAERYGFEVPGTALSSFTTEAADPSAGQIADLADEIREEGVPAIFSEKFTTGERIMERIAREAGVELADPLFTDALAREGETGDTYVEMMRYNARTVTEALGGTV